MRGITRVKRILRNSRRLAAPVAAILIYHRVTSLPADSHHLAVAPDNFSRHLQYIHEKYTPLTLSGLIEAMDQNDLPHRSVVVTFDDGYADNFHQALPLLESCQVPATIFVVSGAVGSEREFWWDDLERILLASPDLPEKLTLSIPENGLSQLVALTGQRMGMFRYVYHSLFPLSPALREEALARLVEWAGVPQAGRIENLPMQPGQLIQIAQSPFIEIGAHTRTHPSLATREPDEQCVEIEGSRADLETLLGKPVRTFSYPYGNPKDFSPQTVELVRSAGFSAAVTTIQGAVEQGDDRYQLKRCEVNNWDIDIFRQKLDRFFYS